MDVEDDVEIVFDVEEACQDGARDERHKQQSRDWRVGEGHGASNGGEGIVNAKCPNLVPKNS